MASTSTYVERGAPGGKLYQLDITATCGASSAEFTTTLIPYDLTNYFLLMLRTYPGSTAPTDATDLYLYQHASDGKDILDGGGVNMLDATSTLTFKPLVNSSDSAVPINGQLWMAVSNNSVNAAIVTVELHMMRAE